jgi:hypothetical protein
MVFSPPVCCSALYGSRPVLTAERQWTAPPPKDCSLPWPFRLSPQRVERSTCPFSTPPIVFDGVLNKERTHLFVQDTDGFPGNYAKLPLPLMVRADVLGMIDDWLVQRLR